jgi:hypothetical protein
MMFIMTGKYMNIPICTLETCTIIKNSLITKIYLISATIVLKFYIKLAMKVIYEAVYESSAETWLINDTGPSQ